jgi:uncharacterized protein
MKKPLLLAVVLIASLFAQVPPEHEMTKYVLALAHKGPHFGEGSKEEAAKLKEAHLANVRRMAAAGKLIVSGPMLDDGDILGIFIFRASSPDEVREMAEQDPMVKAGIMVLEFHQWYAAAGLRVNDPK